MFIGKFSVRPAIHQFPGQITGCQYQQGTNATTGELCAKATLAIDPEDVRKPWTGDLDGMIERQTVRVLTVNSKTFYFLDKGVLRGTVVDFSRLFEDEINKKLTAEKKLKHKHLKIRVVFIPVRRDQLLSALAAGEGDIAAANLTITPERQKLVDFTVPGFANVSEVAVMASRPSRSRQPIRRPPGLAQGHQAVLCL